MNEDGGPVFRQVATQLEDAIVDGPLAEGPPNRVGRRSPADCSVT